MKKEYSNSLFEKTFSQVFARKIQDRGKKFHKISRQFVDLESFFTNFLQFQRNFSKLVVNLML
jgi:hypothetical protein